MKIIINKRCPYLALYGLIMIMEGIVRLFSLGIINVEWTSSYLFWDIGYRENKKIKSY